MNRKLLIFFCVIAGSAGWDEEYVIPGPGSQSTLTCQFMEEDMFNNMRWMGIIVNQVYYAEFTFPNISNTDTYECACDSLCAAHGSTFNCSTITSTIEVSLTIVDVAKAQIGLWWCYMQLDNNEIYTHEVATLHEFVPADAPTVVIPDASSLDLVADVRQVLECQAAFGQAAPSYSLAFYSTTGGAPVLLARDTVPASPGHVFRHDYYPAGPPAGPSAGPEEVYCVAEQRPPGGSSRSHPESDRISTSTTAQVDVTPLLTLPNKETLKDTDILNIQCSFRGSPAPQVTTTGTEHPIMVTRTYPNADEVEISISWAEGASVGEKRAANGRQITCSGHQEFYIRGESDQQTRSTPTQETTLDVVFAAADPDPVEQAETDVLIITTLCVLIIAAIAFMVLIIFMMKFILVLQKKQKCESNEVEQPESVEPTRETVSQPAENTSRHEMNRQSSYTNNRHQSHLSATNPVYRYQQY